ncbi:MAG: hypothetical protein AAB459_02330 [Patescibacteria group bacterium]
MEPPERHLHLVPDILLPTEVGHTIQTLPESAQPNPDRIMNGAETTLVFTTDIVLSGIAAYAAERLMPTPDVVKSIPTAIRVMTAAYIGGTGLMAVIFGKAQRNYRK